MGGPFCTSSGCILPNVLSQAERVSPRARALPITSLRSYCRISTISSSMSARAVPAHRIIAELELFPSQQGG